MGQGGFRYSPLPREGTAQGNERTNQRRDPQWRLVIHRWGLVGMWVSLAQAQTFTEVAASAGVDGSGWVRPGDYDNDGDLTCMWPVMAQTCCIRIMETELCRGRSDRGGNRPGWSNCCLGDYDNDGDPTRPGEQSRFDEGRYRSVVQE